MRNFRDLTSDLIGLNKREIANAYFKLSEKEQDKVRNQALISWTKAELIKWALPAWVATLIILLVFGSGWITFAWATIVPAITLGHFYSKGVEEKPEKKKEEITWSNNKPACIFSAYVGFHLLGLLILFLGVQLS